MILVVALIETRALSLWIYKCFLSQGLLDTFKSLKANLNDSNSPPTLVTTVPVTAVPPVPVTAIPPVNVTTAAPAATSFAAFQQAQLAN